MGRLITLLLCIFLCLGCAASSTDTSLRTKPPAAEAVKIELTVSLQELNLALGEEYKTAKLRPVEVFQNSSSGGMHSPVFRLFDVEKGSVYELIGLKEADIVVAINERIVVAPQVISQIVRLLPKEKSIKFEVLRSGKSYLISTKFV